MNKFIGFLICCFFLGMTWGCDDDDKVKTDSLPAVSLGSKEFKTLENVTPFRIPVVLSVAAIQPVTVTGFVKSENGAKEGVDYSFVSREIVIPAGKSSGYFEVEITDYPEYRPDRIFDFEMVGAKGAKLATPEMCRVIIMSNEGLPVLGFANTMESVSEEMQKLDIKIRSDRMWNEAISFKLRILSEKSTAVYGEHYVLDTTQTYTISAGDTSVIIPVTIIDNMEQNEDRYFEIEIYGNQNSVLSEVFGNMKVTILDDEEPVFVCFDKTSLSGAESEGPVWLPVRVKGNSRVPVKVTLDVRGGTAVEGTDFIFEQKELVFPVGSLIDSVRIDFIDNQIYDLDKNLFIGFAAVEGAVLASSDTLAEVKIMNDDFELGQLYEDIMGTWIMTSTLADNAPASYTVQIHGGNTPEEEDANYMKKWILHADSYVQGGWGVSIDIPMYYDATTGEISIGFGEAITPALNLNGKEGILRLGYSGLDEGKVEQKIPTTHSKDYKKIIWEKDKPKIGGYGYDGVNTDAFIILFFIQNVELIKVED